MKRGEKQPPELKAKMREGMMKELARKKCTHGMEVVSRMGSSLALTMAHWSFCPVPF